MREADRRMYADENGRHGSAANRARPYCSACRRTPPDLGEHINSVASLTDKVGRELPHERRGPDGALAGRRTARHRQSRRTRRDPRQARATRRRRMGLHAPPHDHRRTHPRRRPRLNDAAASSALASSASTAPDSRPLTGADIPLGARIIAVCDAYDAMVSDRPYRPRDPDGGRCRSSSSARAGRSIPVSSTPSCRAHHGGAIERPAKCATKTLPRIATPTTRAYERQGPAGPAPGDGETPMGPR